MNWYYADSGQQRGPVSEAELLALVQAGRVTGATLVWHEGLPNWQPYELVAPSPAGLEPALAPPVMTAQNVVCVECGKTFSTEQAVRLGESWVCAGCKPLFLQRLAEGAPLPSVSGAWVSEETVLARGYRVEIGDCLSRAWNLFTQNAGIIIGASLLVGLVMFGCAMVSHLISLFIPFSNMILNLIYPGPLLGGYFLFLLKLIRGQSGGVGDAFSGFGPRFSQLLLTYFVQELLKLLCMLPAGVVLLGIFISYGLHSHGPRLPDFDAVNTGLVVLLGALGLLGFAGWLLLSVNWTFSLLLVADKGYRFWPAMGLSWRMVRARWWMTFLFWVVVVVLYLAGFLACCVGLLVAAPLYSLMRALLYEDNFRDLQPKA
jgi:hypothetical protein